MKSDRMYRISPVKLVSINSAVLELQHVQFYRTYTHTSIQTFSLSVIFLTLPNILNMYHFEPLLQNSEISTIYRGKKCQKKKKKNPKTVTISVGATSTRTCRLGENGELHDMHAVRSLQSAWSCQSRVERTSGPAWMGAVSVGREVVQQTSTGQ